MVKVTIKGDVYSFDNANYALPEAIELEEGLGMPYGEYQRGLARGSAKSLAGFVWLVLKRDGQEIPLKDILSGEFALNESDVQVEEEADPTDPPSAAPDGNTSRPSPKSSASARGSGKSSPSTTSTP
jgi:hypothetical protein